MKINRHHLRQVAAAFAAVALGITTYQSLANPTTDTKTWCTGCVTWQYDGEMVTQEIGGWCDYGRGCGWGLYQGNGFPVVVCCDGTQPCTLLQPCD